MRTLLGKTLEELKEIALELSLPAFTAKQIADWLYKKRVTSIDKMTNLSKSARERLSKEFVIGIDQTLQVVTSQDGTRKYLFKPQSAAEQQGCASGSIESVIIPGATKHGKAAKHSRAAERRRAAEHSGATKHSRAAERCRAAEHRRAAGVRIGKHRVCNYSR